MCNQILLKILVSYLFFLQVAIYIQQIDNIYISFLEILMIKIGQDDFVHINWVVFVYKKKRTRKKDFWWLESIWNIYFLKNFKFHCTPHMKWRPFWHILLNLGEAENAWSHLIGGFSLRFILSVVSSSERLMVFLGDIGDLSICPLVGRK